MDWIDCEVCGVKIPKEENANKKHLEGKKHLKALEYQNEMQQLAKRSVFVKWPEVDNSITPELVTEIFGQFGPVSRVNHHPETKYAFVEFNEESAAGRALEQKEIEIRQFKATISKRRVNLHSMTWKRPRKKIDVDAILKDLATIDGFNSQITYLIRRIGITEEDTKERQTYVNRIEEELKKYFLTPKVRMFGSSLTPIGTIDSDVDACLVLNDLEPLEQSQQRDKITLLTADVEMFKERKIHGDELARLQPADQVRFVSKIMNDIRKHCNWIDHQRPITDCRCPLVQMVVDKKFVVDLSVDNLLGCAKTDYLNDMLRQDKSGNLRKILLALRFWFETNGLFDLPTDKYKASFNAYMIDLLMINRLQALAMVQPFAHHLDIYKKAANGWRIDFFQQENHALFEVNIDVVILKFFAYIVQFDIEKNVFSLRNGAPMRNDCFDEFNPKLPFKKGALNIQDPLEASHNVAQNITHKALVAFRNACKLSLAMAKKKKDDYRVLLRVWDNQKEAHEQDMTEFEKDAFKVVTIPDVPDAMTTETFASTVNFILEMVMHIRRMDEQAEPPCKKARNQEGQEENIFVDLKEYGVYGKMWVGRRNVRRQLERQNPAIKNDKGFDTEVWVSVQIAAAMPPQLIGRISVSVLKIDTKAKIIFNNIDCNATDLNNAIHFLETTIQNHLNYILAADAALSMHISNDLPQTVQLTIPQEIPSSSNF